MSDDEARKRIIELLEQLDLIDLATRRFGEMSTGNKQRLALARALLARPPVLLLDEPTRSLDPLAASRMRDLIRSLACGDAPVSILLTSHNLPEVEELCGRIAVINHGRIRALGTPDNLRALHKETEKVKITARWLASEKAHEALGTWLTDLVVEETSDATIVNFTRESLDDNLDKTLRAVQLAGGTIIDVYIERATLLDVLESYQSEPDDATSISTERAD